MKGSSGDEEDNLPEEDQQSVAARMFGERLYEKSACDWTRMHKKDDTAKAVVEYLRLGAPLS